MAIVELSAYILKDKSGKETAIFPASSMFIEESDIKLHTWGGTSPDGEKLEYVELVQERLARGEELPEDQIYLNEEGEVVAATSKKISQELRLAERARKRSEREKQEALKYPIRSQDKEKEIEEWKALDAKAKGEVASQSEEYTPVKIGDSPNITRYVVPPEADYQGSIREIIEVKDKTGRILTFTPESWEARRGAQIAKIQFTDKVDIFKLYYIEEMAVSDIAERYGIVDSYVYRILADKSLRKVIEDQNKSAIDHLVDTMQRNVTKIDDIISRYLDEAAKEERIAVTSLPNLFSVYGTIVDKQIRIQETIHKREELAVRKAEAEAAARLNTGLMGDFLQVIQGANSIRKPEPDSPQNEAVEE